MSSRAPGPSADLSRIAVIVPVRWLEGAKSRLGGTLDAEERQAIVAGLLQRTIRAARSTPAVSWVGVVSPDPAVLELAAQAGAIPIRQESRGLNPALAEARIPAIRSEATAVLVIPADLPSVSAEELAHLIGECRAVLMPGYAFVAIVPDRHRTGTNLLLVSPPRAIDFNFGPNSRSSHARAARAAGAMFLELEGSLSVDLDTPDDLLLAEETVLELGRGGGAAG